ncbi:Flp pilus assembly protein CpaB [Sneathiella chinensis]|uniref:Flp pilus assembly protein CpaB n=1 Tax=Sneathiella chinensis TaxID=349750 RepID=A0ABQ5U585_9PROT|nr:Flp pilus assembly protein CpaB [Sneathiella chinensis]GLQ06561.1 Flp pilus assembly protein CpaB [Sneathiella chinensis]
MARKIILVVFALLIAGTTIWFVRNWAGSQTQPVVASPVAEVVQKKEEPKVKILVAARDLPAGTLVREEHLTWQVWPKADDLQERYVVENVRPMNEFFGTVVRRGITTGEPITDSRTVRPGQSGFLAAVLSPGSRAISIDIDATSGIAGFIFPGDRVDVVLTHSVTRGAEGGEGSTRHASETVLTDVRVVAMDQSTNDQNQQAAVRRIATLEVSPKEVEIISVAREIGRLSLSLRSIARTEDEEKSEGQPVTLTEERGRGYTWDSEASALISAPRRSGGTGKTVVVVRAGAADKKSFD